MKSTKEILSSQDKPFLSAIDGKPYMKFVYLPTNGKNRRLGTLDQAGDGTFQTTRKLEHIFRKTQSMGLSYDLLTNEDIDFKWIVITLNNKSLVTSRAYFLQYGYIHQFKGWDVQVMLPLNLFGIDKARAFDAKREKAVQQNLFGEVA